VPEKKTRDGKRALARRRGGSNITIVSGESNVPSGTVKFFNSERGFGFIVPDDGGNDVFVHIRVVEKAGYSGLAEGAKVTFDVVDNRGRQAADNLRVQ
jgi:CspA family cold shock protein